MYRFYMIFQVKIRDVFDFPLFLPVLHPARVVKYLFPLYTTSVTGTVNTSYLIICLHKQLNIQNYKNIYLKGCLCRRFDNKW